METELIAQQREDQLKFERLQLEQKLSLEQRYGSKSETGHDKLPKLGITSFAGNREKWLCVWNTFVAELESFNISPITKFAYLKKYVETNIRGFINGLPLTSEAYERAKNILETEYGSVCDIVNAYNMRFPVINGTKSEKMHQFYHALMYNVQALESLGKLKDISGIVRTVLNKSGGLKHDLVRGSPGWQSWDFSQLITALRTWEEIHPVKSTVHEEKAPSRPSRSFYSGDESVSSRKCVYCDGVSHRSVQCKV